MTVTMTTPLTPTYTNDGKSYLAGVAEWNYVGIDEPPPRGKKINILQEGGIQIIGVWIENNGFIAWAKLIKRDPLKEKLQQAIFAKDEAKIAQYRAELANRSS